MAEGVEVGRAYVTVLPNATGFQSTLTSSVVPGATVAGKGAGKGISGGILGGLKGIAGPMAALFAAKKIVDFFGESIAGAVESQKVMKTTSAVIKATGGAAKISAPQVASLSEALAAKSGIDDEVIQSGANMLLTFKNVRNEAGQGAAIFNRATAAAVDLSAAGFGSVQGASKMLGKALNDPIKGISALSRAGVTFSQEQKDQIKNWVAHGDILKAQKAIMAEVESQVGGVAAANATMGDKVSVAWGNFQEKVGGLVLPLLERLGQMFLDYVMPALDGMVTAIGNVGSGFSDAGGAIDGLKNGPLAGLVAWVQGTFIPAISGLWTTVQDAFSTISTIVGDAIQGMITRMQPAVPIIQDIWSTIGQIVTLVIDLIKTNIQRFVSVVKFIWENWGQQIMDVVSTVWTSVLNIIKPALNTIKSVIALVLAVVKGDWKGAWEAIKGILKGVWDTIVAVVKGAIAVVKSILSLAWAVIKTGVSSAWNSVVSTVTSAMGRFKSAVDNGIDTVLGWFRSLGSKIISAIGNVAGRLASVGHDIVAGIWSGISAGYGWITGRISAWVGDVVSFFKRVFGIGSPSKVMAQAVGRWIGPGLINPIWDSLGDAERASQAMATALTPDLGAVNADFSSSAKAAAGLAGERGQLVQYGDVTVELSLKELAEFRTLAQFLQDIDRKVEQGVVRI